MSNRSEYYDDDPRGYGPGGSRAQATMPVSDYTRPAKIKTSAAATFALIFGLSALYAGIIVVAFPLAILFGVIGIILGIAGLRYSRRPGVTGGSLAFAGLILAVLGLLIGVAVIVLGTTFSDQVQHFINNNQHVVHALMKR